MYCPVKKVARDTQQMLVVTAFCVNRTPSCANESKKGVRTGCVPAQPIESCRISSGYRIKMFNGFWIGGGWDFSSFSGIETEWLLALWIVLDDDISTGSFVTSWCRLVSRTMDDVVCKVVLESMTLVVGKIKASRDGDAVSTLLKHILVFKTTNAKDEASAKMTRRLSPAWIILLATTLQRSNLNINRNTVKISRDRKMEARLFQSDSEGETIIFHTRRYERKLENKEKQP